MSKIERMGLWFFLLSFLTVTVGTAESIAAQVVKMSKSGICHCPNGQFYDRISNFTSFETVESCLASGGREPKRGQGSCPVAGSDEPESVQLQRL